MIGEMMIGQHQMIKKMSEEVTYIGSIVNINNEEWRVAQKTLKYGREWQYTLSHENTDGTYKSINLNETALENIIESGSRVLGEIK